MSSSDRMSSGRGRIVCWQDLKLLRAAGAEEFNPILCDRYWNVDTWEVLQEMWRL